MRLVQVRRQLLPMPLPTLRANPGTIGLVLAILAALSTDVCAQTQQSTGPSTTGADKLLWVNFEPIVGNLRSEAEQLWPRVSEALQKPLEETGVATYEEAHVDLERVRRISETLLIYGEPLGADLAQRVDQASKDLRKKAEQAFAQPNIQKDAKRRISALERAIGAANNKLSDVGKLIKAGKQIEAFEEFCDITDPVDAQAIWYEIESGTRHSRIVAWDERARAYYFTAKTATVEAGKQLRSAVYADHKVDLEALPEAIKAVAQQLTQGNQAQLTTGAAVTGPQAIEYFGNAWVRLQNDARTALGYARIGKYLGDNDRPEITEQVYESACEKIVDGLAEIIAADASRATPDEATELYFTYLETLPPLITRCTVPGVMKRLEESLDKLAQRSPDLVNRIQAYRAATDDILRWRQRAREAFVRTFSESYPSQSELIAAASKPFRTRNVLLVMNAHTKPVARVNSSVPELLAQSQASLVKQKATFDNLLSVAAKPYVTSIYDTRSVGYVLVAPDVMKPAYDELAGDIYATGEQGAPTLTTRLALFRLANGDIGQAGGSITRVGLVGVPTRFVTMTEDDRGLVRLGPLEPEPEALTESDLMLMFVVQPDWFSDRYTFLRVPTDS